MSHFHPSAPQQFEERNRLLQSSLRPEELPFGIESEYPIILSPQGYQYSYCSQHGDTISSHANLWPRTVIDIGHQELCRVGLIGNVATLSEMRGQGEMRKLFSFLEQEAETHRLAALILWSDLREFYQKLGFQSLGKEYRFHISKKLNKNTKESKVKLINQLPIHDEFLGQIMALRHPTPITLARNVSEFRELLTIPWLDLYLAYEDGIPAAYAIMGKGYDMMGVIHEWGGLKPNLVLEIAAYASNLWSFDKIIVLAPDTIERKWADFFTHASDETEVSDMALVKILDSSHRHDVEKLFIWGPDSI